MSAYWIWRFHVLLCQTNSKLESSEIKKKKKSVKNNVHVETVGPLGNSSKSNHRKSTFEKCTYILKLALNETLFIAMMQADGLKYLPNGNVK